LRDGLEPYYTLRRSRKAQKNLAGLHFYQGGYSRVIQESLWTYQGKLGVFLGIRPEYIGLTTYRPRFFDYGRDLPAHGARQELQASSFGVLTHPRHISSETPIHSGGIIQK
jgi:hypothetical protein